MTIDHICFAVKDLNEGIENWKKAFGYRQMTHPILNTRQKVRVVFLTKEDSLTIKLIEPEEDNDSVKSFVNKGGGFHHICFKCEDLENGMKELKENGLVTLVPPQPGEAFGNNDIAFMLTRFGINIELIDNEEKAGLIHG